MAFSFGSSDSSSNNSFEQFLSPEMLPYLEQMWGSMGDLWGGAVPYTDQMYSSGSGTMDSTLSAMNPYWMDTMSGGVYGSMPNTENYDAAFQNLMNPSTYTQDLYADIMGGQGNDYVGALGSGISDMYGQMADRSLATLDQRAGLMSGSSPWEGAMADILTESDRNLGNTLANLGYSTFDQDLNNKLDIAKMADTNWLSSATSAMDTAAGTLGNEQQTMFGGLDFGGDLWNSGMMQMTLPLQMMQYYSSMMNPVTLSSGSSSGDSSGFGFTL